MTTPHKHAELIKAWADGAEIEFWSRAFNLASVAGFWDAVENPSWGQMQIYRIKPKPKQDVVQYLVVSLLDQVWTTESKHNLKLTFDGDTNQLKSAEVTK